MTAYNVNPLSHQTANEQCQPTASLATLRLRAVLLGRLREFFSSHGYLEVDTPILSRESIIDAHLEPFVTHTENTDVMSSARMYLQTSPELAMKRLLAAGATAIYQITHAFRQAEFGRYHNPEFTIIEWYRVGDTHFEQMTFVEELVCQFFQNVQELRNEFDQPGSPLVIDNPTRPFPRMTYDEAFEKFTGSRVLELAPDELLHLASSHGMELPPGLSRNDRDGLLNLLLAELVEPHLGGETPVFLHDYPASQASLAKIRADKPPVAERFELYIQGVELCNGYHELTDSAELIERGHEQAQLRAQSSKLKLPEYKHLLHAMNSGLPDCSGVALGFDRLMMLAVGAQSISEVIAFPFDRA